MHIEKYKINEHHINEKEIRNEGNTDMEQT
jgi:hypothetical protein